MAARRQPGGQARGVPRGPPLTTRVRSLEAPDRVRTLIDDLRILSVPRTPAEICADAGKTACPAITLPRSGDQDPAHNGSRGPYTRVGR